MEHSKAVKQIHDHLVQTFGDDAYFTSPRPSSLPTQTADGLWQVQVLNVQILEQVRGIICQYGLRIIREVPRDDSHSPTIEDLAAACGEILPPEICSKIAQMSMDEETLPYVIMALMEHNCEDPVSFLIEKGILEDS